MRCFVILPIAASMLAGCGAASADDPASNHGTYEIDAAMGATTASITTAEGTLRINSGVNVAADLPDGWSLYPGAEVQEATNASMADGKHTILTFISEDSPADIIAFYREQAEGKGIAIQLAIKTDERQMIAGSKDSGTGFSITANRDDNGNTTTNLTIGDKYGGSNPVTIDAAEPAQAAQ